MGTNQMPVSPKNVVVAGRVDWSDAGAADCDVVELDCAPAAAAHSTQAAVRAIERIENVCGI
jgi:hypothetical protein